MTELMLAGRRLPHATDDVRRYAGLPWSGGTVEVWAPSYYDYLEDSEPWDVGPIDVLAAAALHPKLTQRDLTWFVNARSRLRDFLATVEDNDLADSDPAALDVLPEIAGPGIELSLLTKVLHRKRPRLIPLLDRRIIDWYRHQLTARGSAAWPQLTRVLAGDLAANRDALDDLQQAALFSHVRIADIAIWMELTR